MKSTLLIFSALSTCMSYQDSCDHIRHVHNSLNCCHIPANETHIPRAVEPDHPNTNNLTRCSNGCPELLLPLTCKNIRTSHVPHFSDGKECYCTVNTCGDPDVVIHPEASNEAACNAIPHSTWVPGHFTENYTRNYTFTSSHTPGHCQGI